MINPNQTSKIASVKGEALFDGATPTALATKLGEVLGFRAQRTLRSSVIEIESYRGSTAQLRFVVTDPTGEQTICVLSPKEQSPEVQSQISSLLPSTTKPQPAAIVKGTTPTLPYDERLAVRLERYDTDLTDLFGVSSIYPATRLSVTRSLLNSMFGAEIFTPHGIDKKALQSPKLRATEKSFAACEKVLSTEKEIVRRHGAFQSLRQHLRSDDQRALGDSISEVFGVERVRHPPVELYHGVRIPHDASDIAGYIEKVAAIAQEGIRASQNGPHYPGFDEIRPAYFGASPVKTHGALLLSARVAKDYAVFTPDSVEWCIFSSKPIRAEYGIVLKTPDMMLANPEGNFRVPNDTKGFYDSLRAELQKRGIPFKILADHRSITAPE